MYQQWALRIAFGKDAVQANAYPLPALHGKARRFVYDNAAIVLEKNVKRFQCQQNTIKALKWHW